MNRLRRMGATIWRVLVGAFVCQYVVTAPLAVGWTYRYMRRAALRRWYEHHTAEGASESFATYARRTEDFMAYAESPRWFRAQRTAPSDSFRERVQGWLGSLWINARIGVQGVFNTFVLTLVPALLWTIGWYSGWDNSFNKGYEQYSVGITLCMTGNVLFMLAMLYVPMAQARQAATGDWRAFYEFKTVWGIVRQRRLACLVIAGMYSLVSIPVTLLKTLPWAIGMNAAFADHGAVELLAFLNRYFFLASGVGFVAYVFLHAFTARIYADGVVAALARGRIAHRDLHHAEKAVFASFGIGTEPVARELPAPVAFAKVTMGPGWRAVVFAATLGLWFSFVAQIYVSEFLNYHPIRGWANQSLVQVPWFRYVPSHLIEAAEDEQAAHAETNGLSD